MAEARLKVAWISYFPVEWLPEPPPALRHLPKHHPATWLQVLVDELKRLPGLELHVIELRKGIAQDVTFQWEGVTFHCLKVPGGLRAPSLFWLDTILIRRKLKELRPDLVHAWGTEKGAALVASRLPYPYLVSLQGLMELFSQLVPVGAYERLAARFEKVSLRRARFASGESAFVVNYLRAHYPHLNVSHIEHPPSRRFYALQRAPVCQPVQFLFLGSVAFRKGTDLLLLALDQLKDELDFRLTLTGYVARTELIAQMRTRTSAALWERVDFLEGASAEQVNERLARSTMLLFPTRADTGPVAVKEAAVAGLPVLGSVMGGIPDYITPGENGLLFPPGDLAAFKQAIRQACAHPLLGRGQVAAAALARVRQQLDPAKAAGQFFELYRSIARSSAGPGRGRQPNPAP